MLHRSKRWEMSCQVRRMASIATLLLLGAEAGFLVAAETWRVGSGFWFPNGYLRDLLGWICLKGHSVDPDLAALNLPISNHFLGADTHTSLFWTRPALIGCIWRRVCWISRGLRKRRRLAATGCQLGGSEKKWAQETVGGDRSWNGYSHISQDWSRKKKKVIIEFLFSKRTISVKNDQFWNRLPAKPPNKTWGESWKNIEQWWTMHNGKCVAKSFCHSWPRFWELSNDHRTKTSTISSASLTSPFECSLYRSPLLRQFLGRSDFRKALETFLVLKLA